MKLDNRVAVITGAGSGIGRASAILFAREGARVVAADIDDKGGQETLATIKANGGEAIFVHTDVSKASDAENLIKKARNEYGKIDILFNVAGIGQSSILMEDLEESMWDHIYAVNVKGTFLPTKYAVPLMKEARYGVIINIGSMAAIRPKPRGLAYTSSKGAINAFTKSLAIELTEYRIRVNVINPAATDTAFYDKSWPADKIAEGKKAFTQAIPFGRMVTAEEIAHAGLYLASDEAAMITGSAINVDGGRGI